MFRKIRQWREKQTVKRAVGSFDAAGLIRAVNQDDIKSIQTLLNAGISPDSRDAQGIPAISLAIENNHPDALSLLLEAHADPNLTDQHGHTPTMLASRAGIIKMLTQLLENGSDVDAQDNTGHTALMLTQSVTVAKLLIQAGAHTDLQNEDGKTALMLGVEFGHTGVVKSLLTAGADPNLMDLAGKTALDRESLSPGLIKILRNAGGKTESELLAAAEKQTEGSMINRFLSVAEWAEQGQELADRTGRKLSLHEWEQLIFANGSAVETLQEEIQWFLDLLVEFKRIGMSVRDIAAATQGKDVGNLKKIQAQISVGVKGFADYLEQVALETLAIEIPIPEGAAGMQSTVLNRWIEKDGVMVEAGQVICELKQGEKLLKIQAEKSGKLVHKAWKGDFLTPGNILGRIEPLPPEPKTQPEPQVDPGT